MSDPDSIRAGFIPARVVHLHPSRFCNLTCQHCYSASGPKEDRGLRVGEIIAALEILRGEGYEVVSLSGGEPLLYPDFEVLAREAYELGFQVNLITNGAPVGGRVVDAIAQYVTIVAISLDGAPDVHNQLRGDERAFFHVERAITRLAERNIPFGLSYCVSKRSLVDMPWAFDFAEEKGAKLLQFHPFAAVGRGRFLADQLSLNEVDLARAYVIAAVLEALKVPTIQIDIASVRIAQERRGDYRILELEEAANNRLSDLISPIVIEETGTIYPFSYGIHRSLAMGRIDSDLPRYIADYKERGWQMARALLEIAFAQLVSYNGDFIDWFDHVVQTSFRRRTP